MASEVSLRRIKRVPGVRYLPIYGNLLGAHRFRSKIRRPLTLRGGSIDRRGQLQGTLAIHRLWPLARPWALQDEEVIRRAYALHP